MQEMAQAAGAPGETAGVVDEPAGAMDPQPGVVDEPAGAMDPQPGVVDEIWSLLRILFGQHRRQFLIAASELDLHPAQAGALMQLSAPLPMSELAGRLGCDSSNVTGLVDRLEARGLVAREPSPDDRRVKHVVLSTSGRAMRRRMFDQVVQVPAGFDRLGADEQRQLRDLLRRVLEDHPDLPGEGALR